MTRFWGDVVARVSGLEGGFLRRDALASLGAQPDLASFASHLDATGRLPVPIGIPLDAPACERAFRRAAARPLATVARWAGDRMRILQPLFEEEDRRSIRALLRGAAAGAPAEERLSGLVPTPALPHAALRELAEQPSIELVVATLVAWKHPLAESIRAEAARPRPDLLALETSLRRRCAERALEASRRAPRGSGSRRFLDAFLRRSIDVENAFAALQLRSPSVPVIDEAFVRGGRLLARTDFDRAVDAPSTDAAAAVLSKVFSATDLAPVFATDPARMRDEYLATELRIASRALWDDPIGMPRVIMFFLHLRAEARDLRNALWAVALGAPFQPSTLVSPP